MASKFGLLITGLVCAFALHAEDAPVAVSEFFSASLDTLEYGAHSVKSLESPVEIYSFKGAAIVAKNLDSGVTETVVADAAKAGYVDWTPSSGGVWELCNAQDGTARFTVRYSLFGNVGQGDGTAANPVKIVDCTEVKDLAENDSDGFAFVLLNGEGWSADMELPAGFSVSDIGDGKYMLEVSSDDKVYSSLSKRSVLYTDGAGPNRQMRIRETRHVSYSGDNWLSSGQAGSVVAMVSPSGTSDERQHTGTGFDIFAPTEKGRWNMTLESENIEFSAFVDVLGWGTAISIR
jgi:hypothetical protein